MINTHQEQTQPHPHQSQENPRSEGSEEWDLLWGVRRSIRYHDRRRRFFEACHSIVVGSGIALATIGFAIASKIIDEHWLAVFSVFTMLIFLLDLLFAFSRCACHHTSLKHRFGELEKDITMNNNKDDIKRFVARRLEIEKDEPPIRRALDLLCHNELAKSRAETQDYIYKVTRLQRFTAQIFSWPNIQVELSNTR